MLGPTYDLETTAARKYTKNVNLTPTWLTTRFLNLYIQLLLKEFWMCTVERVVASLAGGPQLFQSHDAAAGMKQTLHGNEHPIPSM